MQANGRFVRGNRRTANAAHISLLKTVVAATLPQMSPEPQSKLTKSSELLEQAGMSHGPNSLTPPTQCYSPFPELCDPPVNYDL